MARASTDAVVLVGAPAFDRDLANAAFVCAEGEVKGVYRKHYLPNYGVFDEHRYFAAGRELVLLELGEALRRPHHLRGRLAAGAAGDRSRARGGDAARQPVGLAIPRRQGRGPRGDAGDPRPRQCGLRRLLQPRRRPGRARVRRALGHPRRRGRGHRARTRVRGGAARRRRRPDRGHRAPAPRRAPPRARALAPRPSGRDDDPPRCARRGREPGVGEGFAVRAGARADAPRARSRPARLRAEERLPRRRDRDLGRDRLGRHGRDRRGRARDAATSIRSRCRRASRPREPGTTHGR